MAGETLIKFFELQSQKLDGLCGPLESAGGLSGEPTYRVRFKTATAVEEASPADLALGSTAGVDVRSDATFLALQVRSDESAKTLKIRGIRPGGKNFNTEPAGGAAAGAAQFGSDAEQLLQKGKAGIVIMCVGIAGLFWSVWQNDDSKDEDADNNVGSTSRSSFGVGSGSNVDGSKTADWNSAYDATSGKVYWYNTKTDAVQWLRPYGVA